MQAFRQMPTWKKAHLVNEATRGIQQWAIAGIRHQHPNATTAEIRFHLALTLPGSHRHRDSSFYEPTCSGRISPTWVEVDSPEALLGSRPKVPVCPTVPNPKLRMFSAAFSSRSSLQPQEHAWVRVDRDFFTIAPQLEHFWLVYCGFTAIVIRPNTLPKYSNHILNWYHPASLIDLAKQWFFTMFWILKSS